MASVASDKHGEYPAGRVSNGTASVWEVDPSAPLVYVSVPLTGLQPVDEASARLWESAVSLAVLDAAMLKGEDWTPNTYSGLDFPIARTESGAIDIFRHTSNACWTFADAMIGVMVNGGSVGVGVELAWAVALGVPILYIHPSAEMPSRLVKGMWTEASIEFAAVDEPVKARGAVTEFLIRNRATIEDHRRRRKAWEEEVGSIQLAFERAWRDAMDDEREDIAAVARVKPARIERLVRDASAFATASLREIHAVANAMSIDLRFHRPLSRSQRAAFVVAARTLALTPDRLLELLDAGELAANQAANRSALSSPEEWAEFAERLELSE